MMGWTFWDSTSAAKLPIKPSKAAVKRIRARLTAEMRALRGHNTQMVLIRLNPIIRGWSAYYRHAVSARVFNELDAHVWKLTYKWANFTHPHKGKRWITSRYFGAFNSARLGEIDGCSATATAAPS
jgi:RNA-directed DNA polymerase